MALFFLYAFNRYYTSCSCLLNLSFCSEMKNFLMCIIVYNISYYHPEFQCQFAAIFKYSGIIIIYLCIHLINISVQISLHLCQKFDKKTTHPSPIKLLHMLFKIVTENPISGNMQQKRSLKHIQLNICFPKKSPNLKTFLFFDHLHLYVYKEQQRG